jgi:outer membrane receptor for ferrienterochelin and colicins
MISTTAWSQAVVRISDSENNERLSQALVVLKSLQTAQKVTTISNKNGEAIFEKNVDYPCQLSITYLGFQFYLDTLKSPGNYNVSLLKEVRFLKEAVISDPLTKKGQKAPVNHLQIIHAETFDKMAANTVKDVLNNQLNFRISQDNATGSSQMSLQGLNGQNVKILIDGIPVIGKVFDQVDLSQLNLNNVDRIEIIQGPMSVSYGTNALAGTINIITRKTTGKVKELGLNAYSESNHILNTHGYYNYSNQRWSGQLNSGRNFFGGWSALNTDRTWDWNLKEQYFLRGQLAYRFKNWDVNYRTEAIHEKIKDRGKPNLYGEKAIDEYFFTNRMDHALQLNGKIRGKYQVQSVVGYNYYEREREKRLKDLVLLKETPSLNPLDYDTTIFKSLMSRTTVQRSSKKASWLTGMDVSHEWGLGERVGSGRVTMGDYAAFGSLQWTPTSKLEIRSGLRAGYHTTYKMPLIPSVQMAYGFRDGLNVRGSWAKGFRAPSLKELYLNFIDANHQVYGNENLKAEYSDNFQLGVEKKWNLDQEAVFKMETNLFYNNILNKIDLFITSATGASYQNVGWFNSRGANLNLTYVNPVWKHQAGYALTGISSAYVQVYENVAYNHEWQYNLQYFYEKWGLTASLFIKYNGAVKRMAIEEETQIGTIQRIDPYTLADFTLNKKIGNRWQVSAGAKNILNVTTINSTATAGAHAGGSGLAIGTGRTIFAKLAYTWKEKK